MVDLKKALFFVLLGWVNVAPAGVLGTSTVFDVHSESFFSPDYSTTTEKSFYFLGLRLRTEPLDPMTAQGLQTQISAELSPQTPEVSYLNPRELYYRTGDFTMGRRLHVWSSLDDEWNLGLYQPQFRWNPLNPESQGLVGAFYDVQAISRDWRMSFYASPLFVPDQGPGYVLKENQFVRSNPWFQYQPTSARLTGSTDSRRLLYDVEIPPLERVVFSPGAGGQIVLGSATSSAQLKLASAYKPANQVNLGLFFTAEPTDVAHVFVAPTVFYHSISSADLTLRTSSWEWTNAAAYEVSQEPLHRKDSYTYVTYRPMLLSSTSIAWRDMKNSIRLSGLWRQGGEGVAVGPNSSDMVSLLPDRVPYRDAVALTVSTRQFWRAYRGVTLSGGFKQGLTSDFSQWSWLADLTVNRNWSVWGSVILVAADDRSPSLYRDLEDNDSFRIGVNYVF